MAFLDKVTIPKFSDTGGVEGASGSFLKGVALPEDPQRAAEIYGMQRQEARLKEEAEKAQSLLGQAKFVGEDIFIDLPKGILDRTFSEYEGYIPKIKEDISAASEDIQAGMEIGGIRGVPKVLKGLVKSVLRPAGDTAITVFAPISAVIGELLERSGGQKIFDATGNVVADKSGITDIKAFQEFAINHPQAGPDFERLMAIVLSKIGEPALKTRIGKPRVTEEQIQQETVKASNKLVTLEARPDPGIQGIRVPTAQGRFLQSVEVPRGEVKPVSATAKIARDLETKAIEKRLTTEPFDELAGFSRIKITEQAELVNNLLKTDFERALRIMEGRDLLPAEIRGSSLLIGLEEAALKAGDIALLKRLARSPLVSRTSTAAQELRILAEREQLSPARVIRDVETFKKERAGGDRAFAKEYERIQRSIQNRQTKTASRKETWEEFVREITC